jgi:hypothetical protein
LYDLNRDNHHNIVLQRAFNKYPNSFESILVVDNLTKSEAHALEKKLILEEDCVNIARGGDGGDTISHHPRRDEIVKKISQNHHRTYSEEWIKHQGGGQKFIECLTKEYECYKCKKKVVGKANLIRWHGENCGQPRKQYVCPHCNKVGGAWMFREHFDKCKDRI